MESGGEAGKICVSEDTKNLLLSGESEVTGFGNRFQFSPNKVINISSVNREINSFFVESNLMKPEEPSGEAE